MKQTRLDELMKKAENEEITLSEIAEIAGSILTSLSRHSNDIKAKLSVLEDKISKIEENMDSIRMSQPVFGIIDDMEDEPD
jgi:DNA repair exonuclease SbcCD ATPase subunit